MTTIAPSIITVTLSQVGPQGPAGVSAIPVGRVVTGNVIMTSSDQMIVVVNTVSTPVTLPPNPTPFFVFTVSDGGYNADTCPITLTPTTGLIGNEANYVIITPGASVDFYHDGTTWRIK